MLFKNHSFQTIYLQCLQLIMLQEESQNFKKTHEKYYTIMYNTHNRLTALCPGLPG